MRCRVAEWQGGLLLKKQARLCSQTDTERQTPVAPACYNWQVVQAVKCLWVTTYRSNLIIYFCPKMLRWFYFIPQSNPFSICSSLMFEHICSCFSSNPLRSDEKVRLFIDGTRNDFALNQSFCFSFSGNRRQSRPQRAAWPNGRKFVCLPSQLRPCT